MRDGARRAVVLAAIGVARATASSSFGQSCGAPSSGDCCVAHDGTACNDATCCQTVCAIDAACCSIAWDGVCAGEAIANCDACNFAACYGVPTCSGANVEEGEYCGGTPNGGCDEPGNGFTPVVLGDRICGRYWADAGQRDVDAYQFTLTRAREVSCTLTGEFPTSVRLVDATCVNPATYAAAETTIWSCTATSSPICLPPGTYRAVVEAVPLGGFPCQHGGWTYSLAIDDGGACGCVGDIDGNGVTNAADLGILLGGWGSRGATDLNGDGTTDGADLGLLLGCWTV
ncbi:MAG: hypothetical protein U0572_16780 [Phycisphaerales bacterium]